MVFFVLPQILVLGDFIIEKTSFKIKAPLSKNMQNSNGTLALNGRIRGKVNGYVDGDFRGVLTGQLNALVSTSDTKEDGENEKEA